MHDSLATPPCPEWAQAGGCGRVGTTMRIIKLVPTDLSFKTRVDVDIYFLITLPGRRETAISRDNPAWCAPALDQ